MRRKAVLLAKGGFSISGPSNQAAAWERSRATMAARDFRNRTGITTDIKTAHHSDALYLRGRIGWGGRIRTFTILINSEVSYRLDHAPAGNSRAEHANEKSLRGKTDAKYLSTIPRGPRSPNVTEP
jgi:hypothetical protein